jgi:hypothetical protein
MTFSDMSMFDNLTIIISYLGYKTTEFKIDRTKFAVINEQFIMAELIGSLRGDVIIIRHNKKEMVAKKKKWWQSKNK